MATTKNELAGGESARVDDEPQDKDAAHLSGDSEPTADQEAKSDERNRNGGVSESDDDRASTTKPKERRLSISVRNLLSSLVVAVLVAAIAVLGWLYIDAKRSLDSLHRQAQDDTHAEQVALTYAVNAAAMDFKDLDGWKAKLVAGTTPELKDRLEKAATSMDQILTPLQWHSTPTPLVAKVRSVTGGTYVVDSFVSVLTSTAQAPDGLQSTATYSVTIDSTKDWQITDVAGIASVVHDK
jgi:Mce-associated membrane protein